MKGKIYLMTNSVDDMIYIGSTIQSLSDRICKHRYSARSGSKSTFHTYMRKVGLSKWKIETIKICKVKSRAELEEIEYAHMKLYPRSLLLNMNTVYGSVSRTCSKKIGIANRGDKTNKFKRGSIMKLSQTCKGIVFEYIRFSWSSWENNARINHRKNFSIKKYGEHTARRMAEKLRNKIYPKPE